VPSRTDPARPLGGGGGAEACDLRVLALDSEFRPVGAPRTLTPRRVALWGMTWTRDARWIVYSGFRDYLYRVRADGGSVPERIELAGTGNLNPFTASSRDRLGFVRYTPDLDIYQVDLKTGAETPLLASPEGEVHPQYSPDGRRIAFCSNREGDASAVWLADADGANPLRLTRGPGRNQGWPRWSPDGSMLSFSAQAEDLHSDVWTMRADGSGLHQMTHRAGDRGPSSWSRDGRWIYFSSDRTGRREIWRLAVDGSSEQQVTREGGYFPFESWDGRTLFYKRMEHPVDGPLLARSTAGGQERSVAKCVPDWSYAVASHGVFYLECDPPGGVTLASTSAANRNPRLTLRYWDAQTGRYRPIATLDTGGWGSYGMSLSPDGERILFTRVKGDSELMMIENFR